MNTQLLGLIVLFSSAIINAQKLTESEVLERAIAYHDPNGQWAAFNDTLHLTLERADGTQGSSVITINLPEEYFTTTITREGTPVTYTMDQGVCTTSIIDPKPDAKRTPCETATLYKDYYTYLYGLPMKLKDPGTHVSEVIEKRTFKGKIYWVLKVTYEEEVGSDVWFFYFDPTSFAMEVYQFYKGDPSGEGRDTGEYILLSEEVIVNDIKIPKVRAWYYNKDDDYLGTDILKTK